jgi:hypothetical protein
MKLTFLGLSALYLSVGDCFLVTQQRPQRVTITGLNAVQVDRRAVLVTTTASLGLAAIVPTVALAADDYVPQLKDMQQIYCKYFLVDKTSKATWSFQYTFLLHISFLL